MNLMQLITIDIILILLNLVIIFIFLPLFLNILSNRIDKIRRFVDKNDGFFCLFFLSLFTIEQIILIFCTSFLNDPNILKFVISFFALVVITTASIQKFVFDKKVEYERKRTYTAKRATETLQELIKRLIEKKIKDKKQL